MPSHWYGILAAVFSVGARLVLFLRWIHRRMRNDEILRALVRDIATNHLPHIYDALHKIAARQGITPSYRFGIQIGYNPANEMLPSGALHVC